MARILHILSQRPQLTGSGITLEAFVEAAHRRGWQQGAVIGVPAGSPARVAGVAAETTWAVRFETDELPFAVPGMSDTMPYPSTVFSELEGERLERYQRAFRRCIAMAIEEHRPDIIHSNHLWVATAIAREQAPTIPLVVHSHGTGLRQHDLAPHIGAAVLPRLRQCDHVLALHGAHRDEIIERVGIAPERVTRVGAGYREQTFVPADAPDASRPSVARVGYAGKLAAAKGVPWLIDAVDRLATRRSISLSLAGGGDNDDARRTRERAEQSPVTTLCGRLDQDALAALLRETDVFVLPSFYEGLPLVLVEALASGCRLVATDLPGVRELADALGDRLEIVALPRLIGPDTPHPDDLEAFTDRLEAAVGAACDKGRPPPPPTEMLASLSWDAVFGRVETVWRRELAAWGRG